MWFLFDIFSKDKYYLTISTFKYFTDKPSLVLKPPLLIENNTAVFRCAGKFGGPPREHISKYHHPYLELFFAEEPNTKLRAVDMTDQKGFTLIKVSDY